MKAAVVILNWNTRKYLEDFLPGLVASCDGLDSEVFVADSGSTDGSLQVPESLGVKTIPLGANFGFTGGYNRALEQISDAEFFVLVNSDIEVPKGWLRPLLEYMQAHPECGICGPKLLSWHDRTSFEYAGAAGGYLDRFGFPYCRGRVLKKVEKDAGQYDTPADVLWVSGACLMIRSGLWRRLGGLDERFFAHMEEIDLCWRAHFLGYKVCAVPSGAVYHVGGGTLGQESPFKLKLNFRNSLLMLSKNLTPTFIGRGYSPAAARRKSARLLLIRRGLDFCILLSYLLTDRWDYARAVRQGWCEYLGMDHPVCENVSGSTVPGYTDRCILLQKTERK